MFLRGLLEKLELRHDDSNTTALLKGAAEGALQGLLIRGAMATVSSIYEATKK